MNDEARRDQPHRESTQERLAVPRFSVEEIMGAMTSQEAITAAEIFTREPSARSKPSHLYLKGLLEAAVEGAFGA